MCGGMFGIPVTIIVIIMIALAGLVGWFKDDDKTDGKPAGTGKDI